jgi:hypothetical protein
MRSVIKCAWLLALLIALSGCFYGGRTEATSAPVAARDYLFQFADLPAERRFRLTLVALSKRKVCTGASHWPTAAGVVDNASTRVAIAVGERRIQYKDFDIEECFFRACGNPISKGQRLEAYLSYEDFELPVALYTQPKRLVFDPEPFWCDLGHWIDSPHRK